VETPVSSHASRSSAAVTNTEDGDDAQQAVGDEGKDRSSSVLSKYVECYANYTVNLVERNTAASAALPSR